MYRTWFEYITRFFSCRQCFCDSSYRHGEASADGSELPDCFAGCCRSIGSVLGYAPRSCLRGEKLASLVFLHTYVALLWLVPGHEMCSTTKRNERTVGVFLIYDFWAKDSARGRFLARERRIGREEFSTLFYSRKPLYK